MMHLARLGFLALAIHGIAVGAFPVADGISLDNKVLEAALSGKLKDYATTSEPKTLSDFEKLQSSYSLVCEQKYRSEILWDYYHMGPFITFLSDSIPKDYKSSFGQYVIEQADSLSVFDCLSVSPGDQECSFPGFGTLDCNAGDVLNPLYFYTLHAIKNFHDWIMRIYHAIGDGQQEVVGLSTQMTLDFVQTEVPPNDTWIATMMAGIFGVFSGGLAALLTTVGRTAAEVASTAKTAIEQAAKKGKMTDTKMADYSASWQRAVDDAKKSDQKSSDGVLGVSGGAGMSSGLITITNGLVNGMLQSATEIIQNELNQIGKLEWALTNGTKLLQSVVLEFGNKVLSSVAHNDPDKNVLYSKEEHSTIATLYSGLFSAPATADEKYELSKDTMTAYYAAAVSTLWDGVFIVKLRSNLWDSRFRKEKKPCELYKTSDIWVNDVTKQTRVVCDDEQAYFVMKREVGAKYPKFLKLYGGDEETLKKYGMNLESMVKSSVWNQDQFGFVQNWDVNKRWNSLLEQKKVDILKDPLFPYIDLEQFRYKEDIWPGFTSTVSCDWECQLQRIVSKVGYLQTATIDGKAQAWPLKEWYPDEK